MWPPRVNSGEAASGFNKWRPILWPWRHLPPVRIPVVDCGLIPPGERTKENHWDGTFGWAHASDSLLSLVIAKGVIDAG